MALTPVATTTAAAAPHAPKAGARQRAATTITVVWSGMR